MLLHSRSFLPFRKARDTVLFCTNFKIGSRTLLPLILEIFADYIAGDITTDPSPQRSETIDSRPFCRLPLLLTMAVRHETGTLSQTCSEFNRGLDGYKGREATGATRQFDWRTGWACGSPSHGASPKYEARSRLRRQSQHTTVTNRVIPKDDPVYREPITVST